MALPERTIPGVSNIDATGPRGLVHFLTPEQRIVVEAKERSKVTAEDWARCAIEITRSQPEVRRRELTARRRRILSDAWKPLVIADIKNRYHTEFHSTLLGPNGDYADISKNPARDIWTELAVLYKLEAIRSVEDADGKKDEAATEQYKELAGMLFNVYWQEVETQTWAFNDVAIWPTLVERRGRWEVHHNVAGGDTMTVLFDRELGGDEPYAVVHIDDGGKRYRYIDANWRLVFDSNLIRIDHVTGLPLDDGDAGSLGPGGMPGWQNPLGEIGIEWIHRLPYRNGRDQFWDQSNGDDLVELTLKIGRFETDTDAKARRSGHKQLVAWGRKVDDRAGKQLLDMAAMIRIVGDDVNALLVDWQINLQERVDTSNAWEMRAAAAHGINPERMRRTGYQTAEGARLSERGLDERRIKMAPLFKVAEQGYYYLVARWASILGVPSVDLDPTAMLSVSHAPIAYPTDPLAQLELMLKKIEAGLASRVDAVLQEHPTWSPKKAIDFLAAMETPSTVPTVTGDPEPPAE